MQSIFSSEKNASVAERFLHAGTPQKIRMARLFSHGAVSALRSFIRNFSGL